MLAVVKSPSEVRARTGFLHRTAPIRVNRFIDSAKSSSSKKWSATVSKCSPSSKALVKSGLEPDSYTEPHRSESPALSTQPNPHLHSAKSSSSKWSATVSKCSPSSKALMKSGLEPDSYTEPHRSESTALSTQPNPHLQKMKRHSE